MTILYEKQLWCGDCRRNHVLKVHATRKLNDREQASLLPEGDYEHQRRKHALCGRCGCNTTPHTDVDILCVEGEWKEVCFECLRKA